jgi:hypothetical protein
MPVPETAMDKENCLLRSEYQVRMTGKFLVVQPITKAETVKPAPDQHFGFRVSRAYAAHIQPAL